MPRLDKDAWEAWRHDYEAGMTIRALAERYKVDKAASQRKA